MTLAPQRSAGAHADPSGKRGRGSPGPESPGTPKARTTAGAQPWLMALAVAVAVAGAALGLNGVLRGWAWYSPVLTTVLTVAFTMAGLRALRWRSVFVTAGALASLALILTFTFFRSNSILGFIPSGATMTQVGRYLRRASETVLGESAPVAPNAGIVLLVCAALGLLVILVDALAYPLALPATSGLGILAVLIVPAMIKPQSVGVLGFAAATAGYLLILGCSHWFAPDPRTGADTARNPGQFRRGALTGAVALTVTLLLQLVVPGFEQGAFPQGSRLNPFGSASGLNPMISLGNSLRSPTGDGRITFATNAPSTPYLRSVTVDSFDGDNWTPDDRDVTRRLGTGRMDSGFEPAATEIRVVTAVNTGQFTSPYLPAPYAPEAVNGLTGRWSWDPATLSIKGVDTTSRDQQYVVLSAAPQLTPEVLAQATGPVQGVPELFIRPPDNVPEIVRTTAEAVTAGSTSPYAQAMAIQRYLRSADFTYSLQSPVQGGYDGNGLSVLADFLNRGLQRVGEVGGAQVPLDGHRSCVGGGASRGHGLGGGPHDLRDVVRSTDEQFWHTLHRPRGLCQHLRGQLGGGREHHVLLVAGGGVDPFDAQGGRIPAPAAGEAVDGLRGIGCRQVGAGELAGVDRGDHADFGGGGLEA